MDFVWDVKKKQANYKNHKIIFNEAIYIFSDPYSIAILDPDHSENEERFITIGEAKNSKILIVSHTYRENATKIRIISARKAGKKEIALTK